MLQPEPPRKRGALVFCAKISLKMKKAPVMIRLYVKKTPGTNFLNGLSAGDEKWQRAVFRTRVFGTAAALRGRHADEIRGVDEG